MNRKITIEISVKQAAEILRNMIIQDAKYKPNGMLLAVDTDKLIDQIAEKLTDEERDWLTGEVLELDGHIRLTTKN